MKQHRGHRQHDQQQERCGQQQEKRGHQQEMLDLQLEGGGDKGLEQMETPLQRKSKDSRCGASPYIAADTALERANSSRFSNSVEQLVAQRHSLTPSNPFTPIQFIPLTTSQSVSDSSQLTLTHPHIGSTPHASPNVNIVSSPLDTYPTNEDFDDQP